MSSSNRTGKKRPLSPESWENDDEKIKIKQTFKEKSPKPSSSSSSSYVANSHSIPPPLSSFLTGGCKIDNNKIQPTPDYGNLGLPKHVKLPKKSYYNTYNQEEEREYIKREREKEEEHIVDDDGTDSEDEFDTSTEKKMREPIALYANYNFKTRRPEANLAVYAKRENIFESLKRNRAVVIDGFTGCGKSTQVPQFILDYHVENNKYCNIVVTQPRKIAARSVAKRVCYERNWTLGSIVGYQVGMDKETCRDTVLTFVTTGVLLNKLITDKTLKPYTHIIIDEVHERDIETDFLLLVIKKILQNDKDRKEKHTKIIMMSATLDASQFSQYFTSTDKSGFKNSSQIVKIPHEKKYKVQEYFLDNFLKNDEVDVIQRELENEKPSVLESIAAEAVKLIISFDKSETEENPNTDPRQKSIKYNRLQLTRGSVLIFLPGLAEIDIFSKQLNEKYKEASSEAELDYYKWDILHLHSTITIEEQNRVFDNVPESRRKIILSTNIAESSITVPDVKYVIDFCLTRTMTIDLNTNFDCLQTVWASVNQCVQRKGRAGRVGNGTVYRMVTKRFFNGFTQESLPEMKRASLCHTVLRVKKLNLGSPQELLAMAIDPPDRSSIEKAVATLKEVGGLTIMTSEIGENDQVTYYYDRSNGDMTFMGDVMNALPIPHNLTRLIMYGYAFGVMTECVVIAAGLSVKSPFSSPFKKPLEAYISKLGWAKSSYSDCFAVLNLYMDWNNRYGDRNASWGNENQWSRFNFVHKNIMRELRNVIEDLEDRLKNFNLFDNPMLSNSTSNDDSCDEISSEKGLLIKLAIAGAFYPNYFHRNRPDGRIYVKELTKEIHGYDLFNTVWFKGFPEANDGRLYSKHIAEKMAFGKNLPKVIVDKQKVFVTFDNKGEKIGPIGKGLYYACKFRTLQKSNYISSLKFKVLPKYNEGDIYDRKRAELDNRVFDRCPAQTVKDFPGLEEQQWEVIITHVNSPSQFWIVRAENRYNFEKVVPNAIAQSIAIGENFPMNENNVFLNGFCLAKYADDNLYYRARVDNKDFSRVTVFFVDFGNTEEINMRKNGQNTNALLFFSDNQKRLGLHTLPGLAVECRISGVKPAIQFGSVWIEGATQYVQSLKNSQRIRLEFYAVSNSVIYGQLFALLPDENRAGQFSERVVKDELISRGFGIDEKEKDIINPDLISKKNLRLRCQNYQPDEILRNNKNQLCQPFDMEYVEPPRLSSRDTSIDVHLKGPWSPLEMEFVSLCKNSTTKKVTIDSKSVNSICVNQDPGSSTSRLLVSHSIAIQEKSGCVTARETTMMPAIAGLMSLLSLIFSPKAELRVDSNQVYYTGVLCGLGTEPRIVGSNTQPLSILEDHDIEIVFDTKIDDMDIDKINIIRHGLNRIINNDYLSLVSTQKSIKTNLFKLLKIKRDPHVEETYPKETFVWNLINENFLQAPNAAIIPGSTKNDALQYIYKVKLNEYVEEEENWNYAY